MSNSIFDTPLEASAYRAGYKAGAGMTEQRQNPYAQSEARTAWYAGRTAGEAQSAKPTAEGADDGA